MEHIGKREDIHMLCGEGNPVSLSNNVAMFTIYFDAPQQPGTASTLFHSTYQDFHQSPHPLCPGHRVPCWMWAGWCGVCYLSAALASWKGPEDWRYAWILTPFLFLCRRFFALQKMERPIYVLFLKYQHERSYRDVEALIYCAITNNSHKHTCRYLNCFKVQ